MSYKVISDFRDLTDNERLYRKARNGKEGDTYTHEDEKRIAFLIEKGFIEANETNDNEPKHVGGGYYELPNGEKVKGKENALKQLESGE